MSDSQDLAFRILASVVGAKSIDQLGNSVDDVQKKSKNATSSFDKMYKNLKTLAAAFVVKEIGGFILHVFEMGDELEKLSQKTGISVKDLSGFKAAAELADVPLDKLTIGIKKLQVSQVEASKGNSELLAIFKRLNVEIKDSEGKLRPTADLIKDLADRFQKLKDGPQKTADSVKLFGKAGNELIPFLNGGSASLSEFALNIDDKFARSSEIFLDNLKKMKISSENFLLEGLKPILPTLNEVTSAFLKTSSDTKSVSAAGEIIGEVFRWLTVGINDFVTVFLDALDFVYSGLKALVQSFVSAFTSIKNIIIDSGDVFEALAHGSTSELYDAGKKIGKDYIQGFKDSIKDGQQTLSDMYKRIDQRGNSATTFRTAALRNSRLLGQGSLDEILERSRKEQEAQAKKTPGTDTTQAENSAIKEFEQKIAKITAEAKTLNISNVAKEKAIFLAEVEAKEIAKGSDAYNKLAISVEKALKAREIAKENQAIRDFNIAQRKDIDLRTLELNAINYTNVEYQKLLETRKSDAQVQEATKNFTKEGTQAYKDAAQATLNQKLALIDMAEAQKESFGFGAREALKEYVENAKNSAQQMKQAFTNAFTQLEDTLVEFIKSGKLSFKNFADAVINDLLRIAVRQAVIAPLAGALLSGLAGSASAGTGSAASSTSSFGTPQLTTSFSAHANGGVVGPNGPISLMKFANGGVVDSPHLALFGEGSTKEAFVPLPDGKRIPVQNLNGNGKSSNGDTHVSITVNMETGETNSQSDSESAKQLGKNLTAAIQQVIINEKRPGGTLYSR